MNTQTVNKVAEGLLKTVAGYEGAFEGAFNIRQDSGCAGRRSTQNIRIESKPDGNPGLEIHVAPGTRDEKVFIPAVVTKGDIADVAYNDFYIGDGAKITIVAGCGVHTDDQGESRHDGIPPLLLGRAARCCTRKTHRHRPGEGHRRHQPGHRVLPG